MKLVAKFFLHWMGRPARTASQPHPVKGPCSAQCLDKAHQVTSWNTSEVRLLRATGKTLFWEIVKMRNLPENFGFLSGKNAREHCCRLFFLLQSAFSRWTNLGCRLVSLLYLHNGHTGNQTGPLVGYSHLITDTQWLVASRTTSVGSAN